MGSGNGRTVDLVGFDEMNGLSEMRDLPKPVEEIQHSEPGNGTADPAGGHEMLEAVESSLIHKPNEKVIISPIAEAPPPLPHPRQDREQYAYDQAQHDIKNYHYFRRH